MEPIENINANRLQMCCQDFGITLDALAKSISIPFSKLEKVVDGKPSLTINQLRKLADFFGRGILFFLESSDVKSSQVHSAQFRTINNQKTTLSFKFRRLIECVERHRKTYIDLREDLDNYPEKFSPPAKFSGSVKSNAATARSWLRIKDQSTFSDYRTAVEDRGVLVFRSNGYGGKWQVPKEENVCGFSLFFETCPIIFVRKHQSEARQTFTMMHELGHLLLHRNSFIDDQENMVSYSGNERDANEFAGCLLVPDSLLNSIDVSNIPRDVSAYDDWLKSVTTACGVSTQVVLIRLHRAGRISYPAYSTYVQWKESIAVASKGQGNRKYRYREPKHLFGDPFVRTVLDSLYAKKISLSRASSYLDNLKIQDIHKLGGVYADI